MTDAARPRLVDRYRDFLPITDATPRISLGEGSRRSSGWGDSAPSSGLRNLYAKVEGTNPTGSFKDRGMVVAVSKALEEGASAIICASTGNTSASAAAYAAAAGIDAVVVLPRGQIALGKLLQALVAGARSSRSTATSTRRWRSSGRSPNRTTTRSRWSTRSTRTASMGSGPRRSKSATTLGARRTSSQSPSATRATSARTGRGSATTRPRAASAPCHGCGGSRPRVPRRS